MMDMSLGDFKYFFMAAETCNLSRAAERLGVGQPTVSQAIKRLESVFRTPLFDRFKTGVQLTPAGKQLYTQARVALDDLEKLKEAVISANFEIEGRYSIGCHTSVALNVLPQFLPSLLKQNHKLEIQLFHALSREITEKVISFGADFGIVVNPVHHPDLVIKKLCTDNVTYWIAPEGDVNTLIYDPNLAQSQFVISKTSAKHWHFSRRIESTSLEVIAKLTAEGCGVGLLPERVARRIKRLKPFKTNVPRHEDQLCLIYRADRHKSASARTIIDSILSAKIK